MWQPVSLKQIPFHSEIILDLLNLLKTDDFPNLLLYGPAGSGKTTIATCFAKDYLGNNFKQNFIELNASNERGINTIRTDVLEFVTHKSFNQKKKIMLLDEADYLTNEAQAALRRIMQKFPNTKFILTCNYINKIEQPIKSRCKLINILNLNQKELNDLLELICSKNDLNLTENKKINLINNSKGDIRYILNNIYSENIESIDFVKQLVNEYMDAIYYNRISENQIDRLFNKYLDFKTIVENIFEYIWTSDLKIEKKISILELLSHLEQKIYYGCNPKIAFISFTNQLKSIYNNPA